MVLMTPAPSHAAFQEGTSITMSPVKTRLELSPGQRFDDTVKIRNDGTQGYDFKVYVSPYSVTDGNYKPVFENESSYTQIARWISFPQDVFHIEPDQSVEVGYHVDVPDNIPSGGQYAAIFAETLPSDNSSRDSGVVINKRVGMLVYARMDGETIDDGSVIRRQISFWYYFSQPANHVRPDKDSGKEDRGYNHRAINTSLSIRNGGNTDFDATASLEVNNFFGGKTLYESKEQQITVLPGTTRDVQLDWKKLVNENGQVAESGPPAVGLFWVTQKTSIFGQEETVRKLVLVLPMWIAILLIVLIAAVVTWIVLRIRKKNKKGQPRDSGQSKEQEQQ